MNIDRRRLPPADFRCFPPALGKFRASVYRSTPEWRLRRSCHLYTCKTRLGFIPTFALVRPCNLSLQPCKHYHPPTFYLRLIEGGGGGDITTLKKHKSTAQICQIYFKTFYLGTEFSSKENTFSLNKIKNLRRSVTSLTLIQTTHACHKVRSTLPVIKHD